MATTQYFRCDGIPCRVKTEDGRKISAEGYYTGKGFLPVSTVETLLYGEVLTEQEFKSLVVDLRRNPNA